MGKARKILSNAANEIGQKATKLGDDVGSTVNRAFNRSSGYEDIMGEVGGKVGRTANDATTKAASQGDDLAKASWAKRNATERGRNYNNSSSTTRKNLRNARTVNNPQRAKELEVDEITRGIDNYNAHSKANKASVGQNTTINANKKVSQEGVSSNGKRTLTSNNSLSSDGYTRKKSGLLASAKRHPVVTGTLAAGGVGTVGYMSGKKGRRENNDLFRR